MKEIELKISQFIDGELPLEEQGDFFKTLSIDEEARNMLNEYSVMKNGIKNYYAGMQIDLSTIKLPVSRNISGNNKSKAFFYFSAAAVIIILMGAAFYLSSIITYKNELEAVKEGFNKVKSELENLKKEKNSINTVLAKSTRVTPSKETKSPKGRITKVLPDKSLLLTPNKNYRYNIDENLSSYTTVKITKDDFLVTPIIGN